MAQLRIRIVGSPIIIRYFRGVWSKGFKLKSRSMTLLIAVAGILSLAQGGYIYAKAELAQVLIQTAWQQSMTSGKQIKPWSWADTWPVARLVVAKFDIDLIILAGDSGRTLAFGPGHRFGTTLPGNKGNSIVSAHRDTHFKFLQDLTIGDEIIVQNQNARIQVFQVVDTQIVDAGSAVIPVEFNEPVLSLVTCYPFNANSPGGSLRYLVTLVEVVNQQNVTI